MLVLNVTERRKRARIEARMRIQIVGIDEQERTYTGNVSKDGIFLETDEPSFKKGQKLELLIYLDDEEDEEGDEPLRVIGKIVRFEKPNQIGKPQGVGIEFIKIESRRARIFDRFLEQMFESKGLGCRKFSRAQIQVIVEIKNQNEAQQALTENLSKGGAFLKTKAEGFSIGDRLQVILIHPTTKRKFVLQSQIVHVRHGSQENNEEFQEGLGIQFTDLSEIRHQDLVLFLKGIFATKKKVTSADSDSEEDTSESEVE